LELLEESENSNSLTHVLTQEIGSKRFLTMLRTMHEIDRLNTEMQSALDEFTGRKGGMFIITTIEHLSVAMKLYIISLLTIMDLLARLVNVVLDLGIADRDVRQPLVFRNDHVKATRIPRLLEDHKKTVDLDNLRQWRNDVVHRGKTPDPEVSQALKDRNALDSSRYSLLKADPISDDEYRKSKSRLQARINDLAKQKQESWRVIHRKTMDMTTEIASELATAVVQRYRNRIGTNSSRTNRT